MSTSECFICMETFSSGPSCCETHAICSSCWDEWVQAETQRKFLELYHDTYRRRSHHEDLVSPCCRKPLAEVDDSPERGSAATFRTSGAGKVDLLELARTFTGTLDVECDESFLKRTILFRETWTNGHLHGPVVGRLPDGRVIYQKEFCYGAPVGRHLEFDDTGLLYHEVIYEDLPDETPLESQGGMWNMWGAKLGVGYRKNRIHRVRYWSRDGILVSESTYHHGFVDYQIHEKREWHFNGQLARIETLEEGIRIGIYRTWNEEGTLLEDAVYEMGRLISGNSPKRAL